ncbi:N-type ATP pyrophosphatase [Thermococcus sp. AM4]|uniref:N-type ATP pyrophosphatase n=1 Tax=Thermococcus sp. (strain AM4) TaxID=246969 RepID=UPI0001870751|nr:N-type ATP pyrophosphatase [Thermococcus sp. AM4]EEB72982.1 N-type ATP pyrophosphatase [Thermococcus sp. AM4]
MLAPIEDEVKRYRLRYNLEALERVRGAIGESAYSRLKELILFRLEGREFERRPTGVKVAVAFSAGSDSTATLKILRWAGFDVVPITAKLPQMGEKTLQKVRSEKALLVDVPGYEETMRELIEKGAPICGRCHSMVMEAVERKARGLGIGILSTGDMLSSGLISIYEKDGIVILNFPAFLALDKGEIIEIIGGEYRLSFGCPLLWELFRRAPSTKRLALQRVLRETRARALSPEMAVELMGDVLLR